MTEAEIAQQLRDSITTPPETITTTTVENPAINGQATTAIDYKLDELVQYKLHDYFGEEYKPNNEESKQRLEYIYETVSKSLEDPQYGFVVAKIRELERIIGTTHSDNRLYRLYQWLKLDNTRRNIEAEQEALRG